MREIKIAAVVVALGALLTACWPQPAQLSPWTPDTTRSRAVVVFGDSLSWDAAGEAKTLWTRDAGVSLSYNSFGGTRVDHWLDAMRTVPRGSVVVVALGTNDLALGTQAHWNAMNALNILRDRGASCIVWLTLNTTSASHREPVIQRQVAAYDAFLRDVDGRNDIWPQLVLQDWSAAAAGHDDWLKLPSDPVHHTPAGNTAYAQTLVDAPGRCAA